jgi:tRNA threonylcarbamoyladenosine biosynthesis protein TsaE
MQYSLQNIETAVDMIINQLAHTKVICFTAPMGAGKTTLIKAICKKLGVTDVISSPTFNIINTYGTLNHETIYHLDLYRIADEEELYQTGVEEVLYSNHICFVEWPQIASNILPETAIYVQIEIINESPRSLIIKKQ